MRPPPPPGPSRARTTRSANRRPGALLAVVLTMVLAAGCGGGTSGGTGAAAAAGKVAEITVAAASDLRPAFGELGARFEEATGTRVTFSFGSSGQLREQILNGAPFDLFASANVEFVDDVIAAGRGRVATKADYAYGRIVLWAADQSQLPSRIEDLAEPRYRRIVIANPEHAPYGLAAKQALEAAGVYERVRTRLVYGENISEAFQIAKSANAEVGVVALSLAIADGSNYTLVPSSRHEPLRQALVVTGTGARGETAARFAVFVNSATGRAVMVRSGFVLPGEQPAG